MRQINVQLDPGASSAQAVDVAAVNQATELLVRRRPGRGGGAGIAGGVDVGLLQNSTQAYIANDATVNAQQDVDVYALSNDNVQTYALGAAARSSSGLVGSVSVWSIGVPYSAGYTDGSSHGRNGPELCRQSDLTDSSAKRRRPDRRGLVTARQL